MLKQNLSTNRIGHNNQANLKIAPSVVSSIAKSASKILSRVDENLSFSTIDELMGVLDTLPGLSEKSSVKFQEKYKVGIVVRGKEEFSQVEGVAEILHKFGITYKISIIPDKKFVAFSKYAKENKFEVIICTSDLNGSALPVVRVSKDSSSITIALNAIRILAITDISIKNRLNLLSKRKQQFSNKQPVVFVNN